jgi:hypothetical protein
VAEKSGTNSTNEACLPQKQNEGLTVTPMTKARFAKSAVCYDADGTSAVRARKLEHGVNRPGQEFYTKEKTNWDQRIPVV